MDAGLIAGIVLALGAGLYGVLNERHLPKKQSSITKKHKRFFNL